MNTTSLATDLQLSLALFDAAQATARAFVAGNGAAAAGAFGPRVSRTAVATVVDEFERDGWPTLRLIDADILHGGRAAYDAASSTIYLSREFVLAFADTPSTIVNVLVEEIGHAIDAQVSSVDSAGDEGAIFASLAIGRALGTADLDALRTENDRGTVTIDGKPVAVEFAAPIVGTVTLDGSLADWTTADQIDRTLSMSGYDIYAKVTGNAYVFAIKAPVAIGADTTAWLNTDQDASTGYQIWDFAGGTEYNINFDATGTPRLYTGDSGQTLVSGATVSFGYSADRTVVEFAVVTSALGSPTAINTLWDINDNSYLPTDYSLTQYAVSGAPAPVRTDFTKKIGIVYSETSAAEFFDPTAYSQLFMAAQNQAAMAGVRYDILTEADLTNLSKLINYDALLFPAFANVKASDYAAIEKTLTTAAMQYRVGLIAAGDFMTNDQTGAALPGDAYSRMKALLEVESIAGGYPATVTFRAGDTSHPVMQDYGAQELIRSYTGAGWRAYAPTDSAGTSVLATQTIGTQTYDAVIATTSGSGGRNVHFSSDQAMGDNNLLWQAIDYVVNGSGVTAGVQLSRNASIVASRNDMDQAMVLSDVSPSSGPGIYDKLLPILQQWKTQYNFVGSYYIDIGDEPPVFQTDWTKSGQYYKQMLAMGNEIGSHSITHPHDTNTLTAAQIQAEFQGSKQIIEQQMSQILGRAFAVDGAALPGAPESLSTALKILPYYDYISGGFSGATAGYPGAIGYLNPAMAAQDKVYIAPNVEFDFTLIEFKGMTAAQAQVEWAREVAALTAHADVPVLVWPWHDYGATAWSYGSATSPYTTAMFTDFISKAYTAGAEFVTLTDLADRVSAFGDTTIRTTISGSTVTATVTSTDAGRFALDLDNLGTQKIASVNGWYAYDADSVFLPRNGGTYTIQLGAAPTDVTHITALPMRADLISLSGNGTNLSFSVFGEGKVTIDLINPSGKQLAVTGATVSSLVGDKLTLDLGATGQHDVTVTLSAAGPANRAPTFTVGDGIVGTTFGSNVDELNDLGLQAGNKIVLAGTTLTGSGRDFALVRFNADGSLDSTFDGDGRLTTDLSTPDVGTTDDFGHTVAVQTDGKLVVAGYRTVGLGLGDDPDFAIARYTANGALDTSFGTAGKVITDFGPTEDIVWDVALQGDGKIVAAGSIRPLPGDSAFAVARYNANGTLDTTFSGDGKVTTAVTGGIGIPVSVAVQSDGKIVVGGTSSAGAALVRYNTNGALDNTFDGDGRVVTTIANGSVRGMALQTDGKILVVGDSFRGGANLDVMLARFNANGSLDTTFDGDGVVYTDIVGGADSGYDVKVQTDGRILVAGYSQSATATNALLLRYTANGAFDGIVLTPGGSANGMALQSDGRIVVGLQAAQPFSAARFNSDGSLDAAFDPVKVNTLNGSVTYATGGAPVVLDADVRAYDPDLAAASYAGATVTLARQGGANAQDVFSATGSLGALTQGAAMVYDGRTVGTVTTNSGGRLVLTFNSNATQGYVDEVLESIAYSNTSATTPASVVIAWTFSDGNTGAQGSGGALSVAGTTTVNFNHAPTITSNGGGATATVAVAENTTAVTSVTASDADAGQTLTYSIVGGADRALFSITAAGALRFTAPRNFEAPADSDRNNSYVVQVRVADNSSATLSDTQTITVNVGDVNDNAPVITTAASFSVGENTTVVGALTSTDVDSVGTRPAVFSISGGADAARFAISGGNLVFASAANFEAPTDADRNNSYVVRVSAADGAFTTNKVITVNVTDVAETGANRAPMITSNGGGTTATLSVAENATTITTVTASDPDAGQALSYAIVGGADQALFSISAAGALRFAAPRNFETPADSDRNNSYVVQVRVADNGSPSLNDVQTITVNVTDVNDNAPVITTAAAFSIAENTTAVGTLTSTDVDTIGTRPAVFSISGGSDAARFAISNGNLVFANAPNYEGPTDADRNNSYIVQVSASDGANITNKIITVNVVDVAESTPNRAPVITSNGGGASAAISVPENSTAVTTVASTDADAGQIRNYFVSGGADAAKFAINATTGVLSFARAPDFELPTDSGANNIYDVIVGVRDSGGLTDSQALAVTVTNLNGVALDGDESANVLTGTNENDTLSGNGGNDTLNGLGGQDVLYGGMGTNVLDGGAGIDHLQGGSSNDIFIWDPADSYIAGGGGMDTLRISGGGVTLDIAEAISRNSIDGMNIIDLTGSGNNTALVSADDVFTMTWDNYLRVDGNTGDRVTVLDASEWTAAPAQTIGAQSYNAWEKWGAQLLIDTDVTTNLV